MYFEEAEVKEYYRKNKEGIKVPYYQVGVKKKSKFSKPMKIGLVDVTEIKKIESYLQDNPIEEKEAKINELEEEIVQLKQQLKEENATIESLISDVKELKEEKTQLQEELLQHQSKYVVKTEELTEEKETSKGLLASITKLTNEKIELEKENIFLKNRSFFNRLINKQYPKESDVPEIVEAKTSEE